MTRKLLAILGATALAAAYAVPASACLGMKTTEQMTPITTAQLSTPAETPATTSDAEQESSSE